MTALVVIAKACIPGRVKTRLYPPFTLQQAATIAAASLADTLAIAGRVAADRHVLYLDGDPEATPHNGFEYIRQPSGSLDERLAIIFDHLDEPTLLIGMDTPQVGLHQLRWPDATDAVVGLAADGGFWALGMRSPRGDVIRGVPMSQPDTGVRQLAALRREGLTVDLLDTVHDVDSAEDAYTVAAAIPHSSFARAVAAERVWESVG